MNILAAVVQPEVFTLLEKILLFLSVIEALGIIPILRYALKMRDAVKDIPKIRQESIDASGYYNRKLEEFRSEVAKWRHEEQIEATKERERVNRAFAKMQKDQTDTTLKFTEILGKLNVTLERLDTTVRNMAENSNKQEERIEATIERVYNAVSEYKNDFKREVDHLRNQLSR